ncbi:MAG: hypothetical protein WBM85_06130 [Eudoraea sp.]|jgi:hypothetical protein
MKKIKLTIIAIISCWSSYSQIEAGLLLGLTNATTTEMNAISGSITGSILYNTTENAIFQYNGSSWVNAAANGTNLATQDVIQDPETRTYDMNTQNLGFINGKVGIGTSSPNSTFEITGSFSSPIRSTSVNTSLEVSDFTLIMTEKNLTIILPAAGGCKGRIYILKNIANGNNFTSINYIKDDGTADDKLGKQKIFWLQSDGINWHLINKA